MPELPEVETTMRGMERAMKGKVVTAIRLNRKTLRGAIPADLPASIGEQKITRFERRGKYILAFAENGRGFCLHLGMSGRIRIESAPDSFTKEKHDHVIFEMKNSSRVVFNDPRRFGMLFSVDAENWRNHDAFSNMGPEPLEQDFSGRALHQKISGKKTNIKAALLDQSVVAGVGNIYACEALFGSGIHPARICASLSLKDCNALVDAIQDVLRRAIAAGGSTLRDYRKTDGDLGYFQHQFEVYDRAGKPCPGCDCDVLKTGGVGRIVQSGRSTFFCAKKQKAK